MKKQRKKTKNNNTQLFTHFCCKLSFCRDYALFGGHFLLKFGGEGHKNILYDRVLEAATAAQHCVDHSNLMRALHIYHQVVGLADRLTLQF